MVFILNFKGISAHKGSSYSGGRGEIDNNGFPVTASAIFTISLEKL